MWSKQNSATTNPCHPLLQHGNSSTHSCSHKGKEGLGAVYVSLWGHRWRAAMSTHWTISQWGLTQNRRAQWLRRHTRTPLEGGGGCSYFWCQCQWGEWVPACARRLRWRQWLGTRGQTRRPPVCIALKSKDGDTIFGPLPSCLPFTSVFWQQIASHVQSQMAPPYGARAHRVTGSNVGDHRRLKLAVSVFAVKHTKALNITLLEESKLVSHPQFKYFRMCKFHGTNH